MSKQKQPQPYRVYMQYLLIGAALGMYYGVFYRESSVDPDYGMAVILSAVAALFTVIVRSWKKGRGFKEILIDFVKVFLTFSVFMVGIAMRKTINAWGGKVAVVIFTTTLGTALGFLFALRKKPLR